jgi:hypothetical protein
MRSVVLRAFHEKGGGKVCKCLNADFFQAIKSFYGYALNGLPKIKARLVMRPQAKHPSSRLKSFFQKAHWQAGASLAGRIPVSLASKASAS